MDYPFYIDGVERGKLSTQTQGLYTRYEVQTDAQCGELLRVYVHGGGKSAYLGVMQPWSGGMYLCRRLSRRELMSFPEKTEYASDRDGISLHNINKTIADEPVNTAKTETEDLHNNKQSSVICCPYPAPESAEELTWFRRTDGTLVSHDGVSALVAFPAELRGDRRGAVIKNINGREYMIFRY